MSISNNTTPGDGGVINAGGGTLLMSNCLVFNNIANGKGGVVVSSDSEIVITTSIFKKNRAFGYAGVFYVAAGTMLVKNSSFVKNSARAVGGVFFTYQRAVINITESFFLEIKLDLVVCYLPRIIQRFLLVTQKLVRTLQRDMELSGCKSTP